MKSFKKLAFTLMATTALMGPISSMANYDVVDQYPINKTDPLHKIASKSVKLYPKGMPDERKPANAKVVSYEPAIDIAIKEQQNIKQSVLDDPYFELNHTREEHIYEFYKKVYGEYENQKSLMVKATGNPLKTISHQIFEASEHDLSLSHQRGQYLPEDKATNKHFTLIMNNKGQLSLFVHDLGVVLPLYKQHRVAPRENDVDAYVPYGKIFTNNQYQTLFFLNRLLSEKPANRFKSGLLYRIQNPNETWESLWGKLFPNPMQPKALVLPDAGLKEERAKLYGPFYQECADNLEVQKLINTSTWPIVLQYADDHQISREKVAFINQHRNVLNFDKMMGMLNPFHGVYDEAQNTLHLINTSAWKDVYQYADQHMISRENVAFLNKNRGQLTLKKYVQQNNTFYNGADLAKQIQTLINTRSWPEVYKFAQDVGLSDKVAYIRNNRITLDLNDYVSKTNPYFKSFENVLETQHLINTSSWPNVYEFAQQHNISSDKVAYINKNRALKTYTLKQLENME